MAERSKASVFVLDRGRGRLWVRTPAMTNTGRSFFFCGVESSGIAIRGTRGGSNQPSSSGIIDI